MYDADGTGVMALRDVSLEIAAGEFCVLVGPSGCGKTTLLNCLAGFEAVTSGEIALDGAMLAAPGRKLLPGADRMVVFQGGALFPWKTVLWNVTCGPVLSGRLARAEAEASARALLSRVGLAGIEGQYPGELSGGMKRRVEIIRALLNDPKVLLLDEPFRALDALTKSVMHEALLELYDLSPKTIFFITHDLEEAISLSDRVVVLSAGPETHPIGEYAIDLPRPRDVAEIRLTPRFIELHEGIWHSMKDEVLKGYAQTRNRVSA